MLKLEGVEAGYGKTSCLKGISLEVSEGEIVVLLGANGAGKTTTLMALSGLVALRAGRITFQGTTLNGLPPEKIVNLGISHVPEGRRILPRLTVGENLSLGAYLRRDRPFDSPPTNFGGSLRIPPPGRTRKDQEVVPRGAPQAIQQDRERVFALFPVLAERRRQVAGTLSGGEQQMLAIARGLMARPKLLLLDEPSLGLAPKLVVAIFETIQRINRDGVSILLVEQNAYQALHIAHRGYVLETGRIVLTDTAQRLAQNTQIKAAYLGG